MERGKRLPARMTRRELERDLGKIAVLIRRMAAPDIFVWIERDEPPTGQEVYRAAAIVADRLCGAVANPIIRDTQESANSP